MLQTQSQSLKSSVVESFFCDQPIYIVPLRPNKHIDSDSALKMLEVYGPAKTSATWRDWPRYREVLATSFNENTMKFVWVE